MAAVAVTWATVADVADALRVPTATAQDDAELAAATDSANDWCFDRRAAAGYLDDPAVAPSPRAARAVVLYAVTLYREGGATDGFGSFAELPLGVPPFGSMRQVERLLGTPRPVVA